MSLPCLCRRSSARHILALSLSLPSPSVRTSPAAAVAARMPPQAIPFAIGFYCERSRYFRERHFQAHSKQNLKMISKRFQSDLHWK